MSNDNELLPFPAFRFSIEIAIPAIAGELCSAAFSECSGLEQSMEPVTLREGGNNAYQHQLVGPVSYGQLSLKRGMTGTDHLWRWFQRLMDDPTDAGLRPDADVVLLDPATGRERLRWRLTRCLPVSLRGPSLDASSTAIAIEELQVAYEHLAFAHSEPMRRRGGAATAGGVGLSASASISVGAASVAIAGGGSIRVG